MTPAYLNPPSSPCPVLEQREDQHLKVFISPHQASSSLTCPTFFDRTKDEIGRIFEEAQEHDEKADKPMSHGSCDHQAFSLSSFQSVEEDSKNPHKLSLCQTKDHGDRSESAHGPVQWMSSKMRLMQKMMDPNCPATNKPVRIIKKFQNNRQHGDFEISALNNSNNTARVCADCNTTTTPLWRGGPRGPKSLCNACGIRQRKARRAMAEAAAAANGIVVAAEISSMKSKVHSKEKKSRTSCHVAHYKNKCKLNPSHSERKQLSFKDFALSLRNNSAFGRVFPQDEAEAAAILLMELSCGLVHS